MDWNHEQVLIEQLTNGSDSLFAVHGDLDGEKEAEFIERVQFIGLLVGNEEFLLPISAVREINMLSPITFVPNAPQYIDGVMNLRGTILPAINLRKMMGLSRGSLTGAARIVIARFEETTVGILVDGITYVLSLLPAEIENQSLPGKGTGAEFIGSISKHGNKVLGILDLQRIVRAIAKPENEADENADDHDEVQ